MTDKSKEKPKGHSRFGGSGIHRVIGCPGSVALNAQVEKSPSGEAAITGTGAHKLAEICLSGKGSILEASAWSHEGELLDVEGHTVQIDAKMCEGVEMYLDYIRERICENDLIELEVEHEFHLKDLHEEMWGTADAVLMEPYGTLEIVDYKNGFHPVEIERNPQMMFYALDPATKGDYANIRLTVVQPNGLHADGPIRSYDCSVEELFEWRDKVLMPAVKKAESKDAPLSSGPHCMFCNALSICPAKADEVDALAREYFDVIDPEADLVPDVEAIPFERLEELHQLAPMMKKFLDACAVELQQRLEAGHHSDHFCLVEKRGNRAWIDEEFVVDSLLKHYGEEVLYEQKLRSPAKLESELSKVFKEQGESKHKQKAKEFLDHLWEKPSRGNVIAPRSTARQEQGPSAIAQFFADDPLFD